MIAVDTNVLVCVLADDPSEPAQTRAAREIVLQAEAVYVPHVVQVETVWVLESAYGFGRDEVVSALDHLGGNQAYRRLPPLSPGFAARYPSMAARAAIATGASSSASCTRLACPPGMLGTEQETQFDPFSKSRCTTSSSPRTSGEMWA